MAVQHLIKGETDWHTKMNGNMDSLQADINEAKSDAADAVATKLDKPVNQTLTEGYVYKNAAGETILVDGGSQSGKFKYTMIVDNGDDGTPKSVEYADDCAGFIEARVSDMGGWASTKLIKDYFKPCVIAPGDRAPAYYLQQANMSLKADGTPAVLTGADGDVMIEIHKLYGKITNVGNKAKLSLMNYKEDDSCFCFNDIGGVEKDVVYRGAYKAGVASGASTIMRSISSVAPLVDITRATGRTYATNRGVGYHQNNIFMLFLYQWMYLLMYKTRDSQTALGQGQTFSTNTAAANTGWSNTKPFCWGDQDGVNGVKFLGVEDFYGNVWELVDGAVLNKLVYKLTRDPSLYNDTGAGYEISAACGMTALDNTNRFITKLQLTNDLGFLPAASGGSSSTFWCDNMWIADEVQVVAFGGAWDGMTKAGAFYWYLSNVASGVATSIGSRLCRA